MYHIRRIKRCAYSKLVEKAMILAYRSHYNVLQYYGNRFYFHHLEMVVHYVDEYAYLLSPDIRKKYLALSAAYCHDIIEDCGLTYNDVATELNKEVADAVYALTNEKGKNRNERGGDKYYAELRENDVAHFVKICDRLANIAYSKKIKSSMFDRYVKEDKKFRKYLYDEKFDIMFNLMYGLLFHDVGFRKN